MVSWAVQRYDHHIFIGDLLMLGPSRRIQQKQPLYFRRVHCLVFSNFNHSKLVTLVLHHVVIPFRISTEMDNGIRGSHALCLLAYSFQNRDIEALQSKGIPKYRFEQRQGYDLRQKRVMLPSCLRPCHKVLAGTAH